MLLGRTLVLSSNVFVKWLTKPADDAMLAAVSYLSASVLGVNVMTELDHEIVAKIKEQISGSPVLVYIKGTPQFPQCGFTAKVVQILKACQVAFDFVNVLENPEIRATLPHVANWPTFPQLYIKGELIGGCDIVTELYEQGELQKLLTDIA